MTSEHGKGFAGGYAAPRATPPRRGGTWDERAVVILAVAALGTLVVVVFLGFTSLAGA